VCQTLHCTALHCTALHCTALHCNWREGRLLGAIHQNICTLHWIQGAGRDTQGAGWDTQSILSLWLDTGSRLDTGL
jgi:hypothetical protein